MRKVIKNIFLKFFAVLVIFVLVTGWIFSGWPQIWKNPSVPPQIEQAHAQEWLDNWLYRKEITIDSSKIDQDLINFPILVSLSTSTFDFSKARSDGYDIRFTSSDGETLLDHERERHNSVNESAEYWVKINASSTTSTTFYMYYGNPTASDGENATSTWNNDYAGVWHKNDGPSQAILDSTKNENHGTKKGSGEPAEADGKIGKAQNYDGSDDYVNLSDSSFLPFGTGAFSVAFWFKPVALTTSWNTLLETRPSNSLTGIWFGVRAGIFEIYQDTAKWNGTTTILNNNWYHVAIVGNGGAAGSRNIKIYLNGVQEGSTWTTDYNLTNIRLWFGRYHSSGLCWPGLIDEIRVSDIDRPAAWIKANYHAENDDLITFSGEEVRDADIMVYRENLKRMERIEANLKQLKELMTRAEAERGIIGSLGGIQTFAVWGIILAIVFGFGLLAAVIFSMWRHQTMLAAAAMGINRKELATYFDGIKKQPSGGQNEGETVYDIKKNYQIHGVAGRFFSWKKILILFTIALILATMIYLAIKFLPTLLNKEKIEIEKQEISVTSQTESQGEVKGSLIISETEKETAIFSEEIEKENIKVISDEINKIANRLVVLKTPTGWLRVRDDYSFNGKEIAKVYPGEEYEYANQKNEWYQIILKEGIDGWVYGEYVQTINN